MTDSQERRGIEFLGVLLIWVPVGVFSLFNIVRDISVGTQPRREIAGALVGAVLTVVGTLRGGDLRRKVSRLWLLLSLFLLFEFVLLLASRNFEIKYISKGSLGISVGGLITSYLLSLPNRGQR